MIMVEPIHCGPVSTANNKPLCVLHRRKRKKPNESGPTTQPEREAQLFSTAAPSYQLLIKSNFPAICSCSLVWMSAFILSNNRSPEARFHFRGTNSSELLSIPNSCFCRFFFFHSVNITCSSRADEDELLLFKGLHVVLHRPLLDTHRHRRQTFYAMSFFF